MIFQLMDLKRADLTRMTTKKNLKPWKSGTSLRFDAGKLRASTDVIPGGGSTTNVGHIINSKLSRVSACPSSTVQQNWTKPAQTHYIRPLRLLKEYPWTTSTLVLLLQFNIHTLVKQQWTALIELLDLESYTAIYIWEISWFGRMVAYSSSISRWHYLEAKSLMKSGVRESLRKAKQLLSRFFLIERVFAIVLRPNRTPVVFTNMRCSIDLWMTLARVGERDTMRRRVTIRIMMMRTEEYVFVIHQHGVSSAAQRIIELVSYRNGGFENPILRASFST